MVNPQDELGVEAVAYRPQQAVGSRNLAAPQEDDHAQPRKEELQDDARVPGRPEGQEEVEDVVPVTGAQHRVFRNGRSVVGVRIPAHVTVLPEALRYGVVVGQVLGDGVHGKVVVDVFHGLRGIRGDEAVHDVHGRQHFAPEDGRGKAGPNEDGPEEAAEPERAPGEGVSVFHA